MFTKKLERAMVDEQPRSIMSQDLTFTGNITDTGAIEFSGKLEGDVQCNSILVSDTAQIVGNVTAEDVVVCGRVEDLIRGLRVTLQGPAHVVGEIHCHSMAVEHGVYFEGKTRHVESLAAAQFPEDGSPSVVEAARLAFLPKRLVHAAE
jgi:cytoskeletal protein CcmA (bactofilin family)